MERNVIEASLTMSVTQMDARMREEQQRAAWLDSRRALITGTDAAQILGLSKFGGPMDVYLEKIGEAPEKEVTQPMIAGKRMERTILSWYADVAGEAIEFADSYNVIRSPRHALIGATLDARLVRSGAPVDAKNIRFQSGDWGEPGTDQIPTQYAAQGVWQMHVVDATEFFLPALFSGQDLVVYHMERDRNLEDEMMGLAMEWYDRHVVQHVPPPIDGSKSATEFLKRTMHQRTDTILQATPDLEAIAEELAQVKATLSAAEEREAALSNAIKVAIGGAKTMQGGNWKANWTQAKDSVKTDWKALAMHYLPVIKPDMLQPFQITEPGSRRFTFNHKGMK